MQQSRDLRKQSEMSGQSKGMLDGSLESDSNDAKRSTNDEEDGVSFCCGFSRSSYFLLYILLIYRHRQTDS